MKSETNRSLVSRLSDLSKKNRKHREIELDSLEREFNNDKINLALIYFNRSLFCWW